MAEINSTEAINILQILAGREWRPTELSPLFREITEPVSVVLATYNRTPYAPNSHLNPLAWCLDGILSQEDSPVNELVLVNDASTDQTTNLAAEYQRKFNGAGIDIVIINHHEQKEAHESRNQGLKRAKNELVYFVDDDSVLPPYSLAGLTATFLLQENQDPNLAAMMGVIYQRATKPRRFFPSDEIYTFDESTGKINGNYDGFPQEYLLEGLPLFEERLIAPMGVQNLSEGHTLVRKSKFLETEGFKTMPPRSYGGGTALAFSLLAKGFNIAYNPDPRFHSCHFRYGNEFGNTELLGPDWKLEESFSLGQMITESIKSRRETGCRVDPKIWHYARIRNFGIILLEHKPEAAENWFRSMKEEFVDRNVGGGAMNGVSDKSLRNRIYERAVDDAKKKRYNLTREAVLDYFK